MKKITIDDIHNRVHSVKYFFDENTTICSLTLVNGFKVIGESHCRNPAEYSQALGEQAATNSAIQKIWDLEAYHASCCEH